MFETRKLCFGGSFNPIHFGHLITAREVARKADYNLVCLIPAASSPFKQNDPNLATAEQRCQMCKLAAAEDDLFEVLDIEITRPGPSYTIDTVRTLKSAGWQKVDWLIGADQLLDLPKWREAEALITEAHIVVMQRPGYIIDWDKLPAAFQRLSNNIVEAPLVDISATELRRRVAASESIDGLTSPEVVKYIYNQRLYAK